MMLLNQRMTLCLTIGLTLTSFAFGAEECCPTDAAAMMSAKGGGELPANHPPMNGGAERALPPGHPPIQQGHMASHPQKPFTASLAIRVQQGTADAPLPAGVEVQVVFHGRAGIVREMTAQLDERGRAMLDDLDFTQPVQPVVRLTYGEAPYEGIGHVITAEQSDSAVGVTIFESQEEAVAWDVPMRHVIVQAHQGVLHVTEMFAVRNASDRTWIGQSVDDDAPAAEAKPDGHAASKRATLTLPIPAAAGNITLDGGFDICCTLIEAQRVVVTTPLLPGTHQFQFSYQVPFTQDDIALDLTSATSVQHLGVFVHEAGLTVETTGLTAGEVMDNNGVPLKSYSATRLTPGQNAAMVIRLAETTAAVMPTAAANHAGHTKTIVIIGAGGLLLAGAVVLLRSPDARRKTTTDPSPQARGLAS